jgi:hypothetical protein
MATTETVGSSVEQIPYVALEELGKIFFEGQNKYGVSNWKDNPSPSYRLERLRHAIRHLFLFAEEDDTEKHLAKVLWFCVTELYLESVYGPLRSFSSRELYPDAKHKPIECNACGLDTTGSTHCSDPKPGCYHGDEKMKGNGLFNYGTPTIDLGKYQQLQVEFEAYKMNANNEIALLNETVFRLRDRLSTPTMDTRNG